MFKDPKSKIKLGVFTESWEFLPKVVSFYQKLYLKLFPRNFSRFPSDPT